MYCPKCGNNIPDDARFCNGCGQGLSQTGGSASGVSPSNASPQISPNQGAINNTGSGKIRGGKNPKMLAVIAVVAVIVILAGVFAYANMWKLMPDKSYYGYLESKNKLISFNKLYKDTVNATEIKPGSKDIEFTINDFGGMGYMPGSVNTDDISLRAQLDYSKDKTQGYISLNYDGTALLDAMLYKDKDTIGLGLPLLYDSNFKCEIDKLQEFLSEKMGQEIPDIDGPDQKSLDELKKALDEDTKYLDKMLGKYGKIALDNIASDSFKVTGADGTTSIYTWKSGTRKRAMELENARLVEIKLTETDMYNIADKVLEEAIKDNKLIKLLCKYSKGVGFVQGYRYGWYDEDDYSNEVTEEDIQNLKESLEMEREELEYSFDPEGDKVLMTIKVIADSKNNIISREITIDESRISFASYIDEKEGDKIAELNFVESRFDNDDPFILYMYDGKKGRGILASQDGDSMEATYSRSGEGKNNIGLDYGTYKVKVNARYDSYEGILTVEKDESSKDSSKLKLRLFEDEEEIIGLNINIKELKDKSKLNFNKKKAIDLAKADEDELEEIMDEINANFRMISRELQSLMR